MPLRPPKSIARVVRNDTGLSMMEVEMMAETAASLGHHGRKAEAALKAVAEADDETRDVLTHRAARAVWEYFIQREMCGMRNHRLIISEMRIPAAVLNRMGAAP